MPTWRGAVIVTALGLALIALLYRRIDSIGKLLVGIWIGVLVAVAGVLITGTANDDFGRAVAVDGTRIVVAVLSLFGVAVATISTNIAANVISPANDFANCAPRLISFKTGGLITCILGILCMPWKLMANADTYINGWLTGVSALLGPIAGIMIAD